MTEFARRARKALDEAYGKDRVKIQLRSMHSIFDTDYIGIDVETWAREGIISEIITYPQSHAEKLDGDVWQEGKEFQRIDLDKYTHYIQHSCRDAIHHIDPVEKEFLTGYRNYRGEQCGPASLKECVEQWMALEQRYGVKLYFEILPRQMSTEAFQRRALELYDCGAERFSLWDAYQRATCSGMWMAAGRLGHKEELREMDLCTENCYRIWKVRKIGAFDFSRYSPTWGG